ncbi:hypothetical protein MN116_003821 [Schistosoma mekongi]|uniref:39S ribosomal protein L35, mitochondrial n=1 Tax=Schistosoma mekongi TaxID=38744 RepID=A0AAE1ZFX6_SCHME|nr:hypothetical protein MN116_003821 [Schistosoma mekongi]
MLIQSNSILYFIHSYGVFNHSLRSISTTIPTMNSVGNINILSNFNQWRLLQIPCRNRRSEEVKKYYSETGDYNPPNQDVIDRFKRLRWGAFIHARTGRAKHLYRRSESELDRRSEHILTNRATSFLLDNMLNEQWRKPKYYPNDIYEPYHKRTGVPWDYKLKKPKFFP